MISKVDAITIANKSVSNLIKSDIANIESDIRYSANAGRKSTTYYSNHKLREEVVAEIEKFGFSVIEEPASHYIQNFRYKISWEE